MSAGGLAIRDVSVPFGAAPGLDGLSLDVAPGERVALVGASGAGKTTLLRAVAGLAPVAGGRIEVGGRDVTALPPERRDAVYLHQTPLLFPHLSVGENVAFPLRVRRAPEGEVRERVDALLSAVGLAGFADRLPRTLSGGQKHRVALARAMAARPAALLLDEPLSALDPSLRGEVREAIVRVQEELRPALLLVTHDLDEAGLLAHRVAVLLERHVAQTAPPAELFARPASLGVARFLGMPNEVRGVVEAGGAFVSPLGRIRPEGTGDAGDALRPGPAVAVFRADAVRLVGEGEGVRGTVVALRHRMGGTTAVVRIDGGPELEVGVDAEGVPAAGSAVGVGVEAARVRVYGGG